MTSASFLPPLFAEQGSIRACHPIVAVGSSVALELPVIDAEGVHAPAFACGGPARSLRRVGIEGTRQRPSNAVARLEIGGVRSPPQNFCANLSSPIEQRNQAEPLRHARAVSA